MKEIKFHFVKKTKKVVQNVNLVQFFNLKRGDLRSQTVTVTGLIN